ncbi:MAG TPA: thiamine ABC transporter substrate-binding protein [Actinophytocola sp.]|nr:thiamine ABC transporter substrate-binding protein [Actinophytocola sp.]
MRKVLVLAAAGLAVTLTGCTLTSGDSGSGDDGRKVVLVTHDSFAVPENMLADFAKDTGITIDVRKTGDAGALTNQLVLTKDDPIGDLAYGVDNTFASRALDKGVFAAYRSPDADKGSQRYQVDDSGRLTAVDVGDVCLNIDPAAFAAKNLPEPRSYADLTRPEYRDMLVVEDPATSSPGLAFLLGSIATLGEDGWREYWVALKGAGLKVASGWEEAYTQDFSGSSGKGPRPIVVSYASSPAAEIGDDGKPRTKALLDTCFRQVEYAGLLKGAEHPADAKKVLDFLLSEKFQAAMPEQMYVYPAREGVALPKAWQEAAPLPPSPATMPPAEIGQNRESWITEWRGLVQG